jgi:hypothetical protein
MDPDIALAQLIHALESGDLDDAEDNFENLTEWIANGGFPPKLHRATGKTIRPSSNPPPCVEDVRVDVWEERDNLSITILDNEDNVVADWIDDDARQMFEDGFFKSGRDLKQSVIEYALEMNLITDDCDDDDEDD